MIISKCPLRVSLVGGSTDLQSFIDTYGKGSVINFTTNLSTYIYFSESNNDKYKITYSKIETLKNPNKIKNDIAREIINYFDLPPVNIIFNSDIPSTGSGLASSSSYTIALLECVNRYLNLKLSQFEVCKLALNIERIINPLTGYQDTYGCGLGGGLKRLDITNEEISIKYLNFNNPYNMYLVNTNVVRASTNILETIDVEKSKPLLKLVDEMELNINDVDKVCQILNDGWEKKKLSSNLISNPKINELNKRFLLDNSIKSVKLCGAGGGGYFLLFVDGEYDGIKIDVNKSGVLSWVI